MSLLAMRPAAFAPDFSHDIRPVFFFGFFFFFTIYYAWHCLGLNETRPNAVGGVIGGG